MTWSEYLPFTTLEAIAAHIEACAKRVRQALGPEAGVEAFRTALAQTMREEQLDFAEKYPFGMSFDSPPGVGFRADFIVEGRILLELRAASLLTARDVAEAQSHLRISGADLCLLINFGQHQVDIRQLMPSGASSSRAS